MSRHDARLRIRLSTETLSAVDELAGRSSLSRSAIARALLSEGLRQAAGRGLGAVLTHEAEGKA